MNENRPQHTGTESGDCHAEWQRAEEAAPPLDLATVRARLADREGSDYWQSLDEISGSPEFDRMLEREFPRFAAEWPEGVSRRNFLHLAAASLGLAGLTACTRQPLERIVPYVRQPEEIVPGRPLFFATAMPLGGVVEPVLAESHEGRPTKLEGNPEHPGGARGTSAISQASVLGLYDPDRSQAITHLGRISTWDAFGLALGERLAAARERGGAGLRLLTGPTSSPTEAALFEEIRASYPQARWHRWDPLGSDNALNGALLAFGRPVTTRYELAGADVVVALDADFLAAGPGAVRHAREFATRRRPTPELPEMNRLYVAEPTPTATGTLADHRLAVAPSRLGTLLAAIAAELGVAGAAAPGGLDSASERWARAAARDLAAHRGRCALIVGESLPAAAHAVAHAIHGALGCVGSTVVLGEPIEVDPVDGHASLAELARDLRAGTVDLLILSGVNPVYDAPGDLDFGTALNREGVMRVHHGLHADETAELCQWHVPAAHFLECWGDGRTLDGTVALQQPIIEPLYGGKSLGELLAAVAGRGEAAGHDLVREQWQSLSSADFRRALHDGFVAGSAPEPLELAAGDVAGAVLELSAPPPAAGLEIAVRPDPAVLDGRFANNGWLQELPKPVSKLTWGNALLVSPRTAEDLDLRNEQVVEVEVRGETVAIPAWILPGQAEGTATVHLGAGRRRAGRVATGVGVDVNPIRSSATPWNLPGATLLVTSATSSLACTQGHYTISSWLADESVEAEKRQIVREATLDDFRRNPEFVREAEHAGLDTNASFAPGYSYDGYAWGMTIDLNVCTGCNACVTACQAENNIPVVGKDQVRAGREMQWLRIDRYYKGGIDEPEAIVSQPVPCMQCEQAPCETVCPVAATVHNTEGLNDMIYNRCVGTRYCANNCPYKARRFNFLLYADFDTPQLQLGRNPDVTVRSRGVMEKCTYCVQRINRARIASEREGRKLVDGEIVTACQQACPTDAIVFGDINDPASEVSRAKSDPRNYALLAELGTRPRTTYLGLVRNPNPELVG